VGFAQFTEVYAYGFRGRELESIGVSPVCKFIETLLEMTFYNNNLFVQQRAAVAAAGQHKDDDDDDDDEIDDTYREPVSLNAYRHVFNTCFNLEFHIPKTDRCDQCEAYKNNPNKTQEATEIHRLHVERKQSTKEERDADRNCLDAEQAVLCTDLENVITLPRSNVSSMLYKRKLNVYNMTGHLSTNKKTKALCVLWNESQSGRTGNDMASAVYRMLKEVLVLHPHLKRLIIWSDACVPQNRNSVMSTAIMKFMMENRMLTSIPRNLESRAIHRYKKLTTFTVKWRSV